MTIITKLFIQHIILLQVLGVVCIFVNDSLNHHLNGPADIVMNLNMVIGHIVLTISSGPTTFNERDGGDRKRTFNPQCCNTILNRLLRNQAECGTSEGGGVGLEICGRSLNHDTKIQLIPEKKIW